LTLELPYGRAGAAAAGALPLPPSRRQPLLGRDFDTVLGKALEPDLQARYGSAAAFQEDWQRVRRGLPPRARRLGPARRLARALYRHPWQTALVLVVVVLLLALLVAGLGLRQAGPHAPPAVEEQTVRVTTDPQGARVVLVPVDQATGALRSDAALRPADKTPLTLEHVPAGEYLVVAKVPGLGFHEVYRLVPSRGDEPDATHIHRAWATLSDGTVDLPPIVIWPAGVPERDMARFEGGEFTMGSPALQGVPPHRRKVAAFYLDTTEVTVGDYRTKRTPPGQVIEQGTPLNWAVSHVTFDDALDYAEQVGKRLPDEAEYEFAATKGGTRDFPGDFPMPITQWPLSPVREPAYDHLDTPPVYGLYSNVAEWTTSRLYPYPGDDPRTFAHHQTPGMRKVFDDGRVVRGAPWSVIIGKPDPKELNRGPCARLSIKRYEMYPGLGFRCARSAEPRFLEE
jgi:formylglycine-generating enzyme required for sulfatase activity